MFKDTILVWTALALFTSCANNPPLTLVNDLKSEEHHQGILLPVNLDPGEAIIAEDGCILSLSHGSEFKTYDVKLKPGKNTEIADLPVGNYTYQTIFCGSRHFRLSKRAPFQVFAGKLSVLGDLTMKLTSNRNLNFAIENRETNRKELFEIFSHLPKTMETVSGYTGQEIDRARLEKPARFQHWEYFGADGKEASTPALSWPNIKKCYRQERESNPLWLGNAVIDASYLHSSLQTLQTEESWSTFTQKFLDCAKSAVTKFHPQVRDEVKYKLYL